MTTPRDPLEAYLAGDELRIRLSAASIAIEPEAARRLAERADELRSADPQRRGGDDR
jgi:antitoxin component of MazEF toxin-antitoxin module